MNLSLNDILVYMFKKYPYPNELSKARVVKMVYLADWKYCLEHGHQLTSVQWYYNHFGPYVENIVTDLRNDEENRFSIEWGLNFFDEPKEIIKLKDGVNIPEGIKKSITEILDFVIELSHPRKFREFIDLVYSTYPIRTQPKYSILDLPNLATEYKKIRATFG